MHRFTRSVLLLVLCLVTAQGARADDAPTRGLRYPSLSPDNESVVFAYRGDIWIAPADGKGPARRLTLHEAQETLPRVSPDGKQVAFSSRRNGGYDLFVVPIEGGLPKQVTFHGGPEILADWSPDGERLLFMTARGPSLTGMNLYEVDLAGGTPRPVTRDGGRDGAYHPDGKRVVYARGFNEIYHDDYTGGANFDLYTVSKPGALPERLTSEPGNERYPAYAAGGDTLYFVTEEDGVANFYARPVTGGARRKVTDFKEDVWRPDLGWDGKTVVFEQNGRLYRADLSQKEPQATALPIVVKSDVRHSGIEQRILTTGPEQVNVSADGTRLVFMVHGDLWTMPAGGGEAKQLTDTKEREEWPRFSPDGRKIAYQVARNENSDIHVLDLATKSSRRLTKHAANDFFHAWSPDGRSLVFTSERSGNRDLWLLDIESGAATQLTRHPAPDDDAVFSPDGRWVAFDSGRDGTQAIYVVSVDGGAARRVSQGTAFFQVPSFSPDGSLLVFESIDQNTGRPTGLHVTSFAGGPQIRLSREGSAAHWSPKGDWIYYTATRNGQSEVYRHPAPTSIDMSEKVPFTGRVEVDLREELGDLFDEIWKALGEGFYDPDMHGVDWKAMREKYRDLAVEAEVKPEFQNVIRQMLAELKASHLGISGGDDTDSIVQPKLVSTGILGVEFEPTPVEDGGFKVASVMPGGPGQKAGLRVGDVVTGLAGKRLKKDVNLDQLLAGTAGKEIPLVSRPVDEKGLGTARRHKITPASWGDTWKLLYANWTRRNAETVAKKTKRRAGYVHLLQMNGENLQKFQRTVEKWNQNPKIKGMVLDIRNNGGGNIHQQLLQILSSRPFMKIKRRQRGDTAEEHKKKPMVTQPAAALYWDKPVVVLINQRSFSDAEVFPHAFRTAGLGKLVGTRTAGGVIGTNDVTLSDGSQLRIPHVGFIGMDDDRLEGDGVKPDILVEITPADRREGRDPQLDKAIEVVLEEIAARKARAKAEKEAEKGAEKEKPAATDSETQPATPPETPQPAPPRPEPTLSVATARNPLADAAAGEWVRYALRFGGSESVVRLEVTEVEGTTVRFRQVAERGGELLPPFPDEVDVAPVLEVLATLGPVSDEEAVKQKLDGRWVPAVRATLVWEGTPLRLTFTNALPGFGLLHAKADDEVVLEALDWSGRSTPRPESPASAPADPEPAVTVEEVREEPAAASDAPFPNPVHDAEEGEWVRFHQIVPQGEVFVTLEVVAVEDGEVAVSATLEVNDETMDGPVRRRPRSEAYQFPEGVAVTWLDSEEVLDVDGQSVTCRVVEMKAPDGASIRIWISNDVPLNGMVREERNGEVVRELVAFGRDGAPLP